MSDKVRQAITERLDRKRAALEPPRRRSPKAEAPKAETTEEKPES